MSEMPEKIWAARGMYDVMPNRRHPAPAEYTRTDLIPNPHAIALAALEKAATAAYVVCAETRHVTLGSKAEAAILALANDSAALAEIVEGKG
jgi:hypothetical protein